MTHATTPAAVLSDGFRGETIHPHDPQYDAARSVYNGSIDRRPAVVVRPRSAADVIDAVGYARDMDLPLSVRCGGHAVAGTSVVDGGVLIDLSALKGVHVDPDRRTAVAQGGCLWGEYDRDTALFGMATPGGRVTTTGVGGFTLGGGYGWLSTVHGLTCDNLVGADMVTADGRLVHVSEDEHPELLFGLRGAGANFGVVTTYELQVHPLPPLILAGLLVVPNVGGAEQVDLVRGWREFVEQAPDEVMSAVVCVLAPPEPFVPPELVGSPVFALVGAYAGDVATGEEVLAPLRRMVAEAHGMDLVQPMPYTMFQASIDGFAPRGWLNYHRGLHLRELSDDIIEPFLDVGRGIGSPMTQGILFHNGGAISRVPEDATAAGNRSAPYMAHPISCWDTPDKGDYEMEWVRRFTAAVAPAATGTTYLNFEPGSTDVKAGYGEEKYQRLVALKDEWDPGNLFRSNHNIPPTGWRPPVRVPQQSRPQ